MVLSAGDFLALAGLLATFVGLPVTLLAFNQRALAQRVDRIEDRVKSVEERKVSHSDWVRVAVSTTNRLERLSTQQAELGGKLDATIGIAGGLKRIGDALQTKAGAGT